MNTIETSLPRHEPWNKGKLTGQKAPLRLRDIWVIRIRLQLARNIRDLALFDLAIDSKLRACDLVKLRVRDGGSAEHISSRTIVLQQKTQRSVQFEITAPTRDAISAWIKQAQLQSNAFLFPSRIRHSDHLAVKKHIVKCSIFCAAYILSQVIRESQLLADVSRITDAAGATQAFGASFAS